MARILGATGQGRRPRSVGLQITPRSGEAGLSTQNSLPTRIGQRRPAHLVALADVGVRRAEREQARDLARLIRRAQVEVQAILDHLVVGNLDEQDVGPALGQVALEVAEGAFLPGVSYVSRQPMASDQNLGNSSGSAA